MSTKKQRMYGIKDLEKRLGKLTVGNFLNSWRLCDEMSLKEFGKIVGLSPANLCDIEKGRKGISPQKAAQIAEALDIPPELLICLAVEESLREAGLNYKVELQRTA